MMLRLNIYSLITFFILFLSLQAIAADTENTNIKLIGKKFPQFNLHALGDKGEKLSEKILIGRAKVVHLWSKDNELSNQQQKILAMINTLGIIIIGINVEDRLSKNTRLPYHLCLTDNKGDLAKALGVKKKLPATFITDDKGIIRYQISNKLSGVSWGEELETAYKNTIIMLDLKNKTDL
jgi:alkyl hydroperoxide reductase subunit AhpC